MTFVRKEKKSGSSGTTKFNGNRPITLQNTDLYGKTFGGKTVVEFLEGFFPSEPPVISMSVSNALREYGSSNTGVLTWSVVKKTNPITNIQVSGEVIAPTGNNQNGTKNITTLANTNTSYTASCSDGTKGTNVTVTITYQSKRRWGKIAKDGINQAITDADILALTGAGVGTGSEFATNRVKNYNGITGGGQYLVFAFPTSFGTPTFKINGLTNNAFTKVRSNSPFVNGLGYSENIDVWVTNTIYASAIASFDVV